MIAFLGMGLLGSNFVRALRKRGEEVHVWNRSPERARALEAEGAKVFTDVAEAVRGAARVHVTLSDDAAVDDVLEKARPGFDARSVIVDHTTTSPTGTRARGAKWQALGIAFQHAPVFMGPKNALESTGVMMASGDRTRFDALEPELAKMTGKLIYLGPDVDRAASMKLLGNLFLISMMNSVFDMFTLAKALDVPLADAATLFDFFNPAAMLPMRTKSFLTGDFTHASFELAMARKDLRLMMDEAAKKDAILKLVPVIAASMDAWIQRGHATNDWTVIGSDVLKK